MWNKLSETAKGKQNKSFLWILSVCDKSIKSLIKTYKWLLYHVDDIFVTDLQFIAHMITNWSGSNPIQALPTITLHPKPVNFRVSVYYITTKYIRLSSKLFVNANRTKLLAQYKASNKWWNWLMQKFIQVPYTTLQNIFNVWMKKGGHL